MTKEFKGPEREQSVEHQFYFSPAYFTKEQLYSLSFQINLLHSLKPSNILEIGVGNGFVSDFFKKSGHDYTTLDINSQLKPDIVGNLLNLSTDLNQKYDTVLCSEVLEHLPHEKFNECLKNLQLATKRKLVLTLPSCRRYLIDFQCKLKLPKKDARYFQFRIPLGKRAICDEHYWELYSNTDTTLHSILGQISKHFKIQKHGIIQFNSFHHYFILAPL